MRKHTKPATTARRASRAGLLAACLALFALALTATGAQAAKILTDTFVPPPPKVFVSPSPAEASGLTARPRGVAVNDSSTADAHDGEIYVTDRHRVLVYDSDLSFLRSFGWDVARSGSPGNVANDERQALEVDATGGTFELRFGGGFFAGTTSSLDFDADPSEVEDALNALPVASAERQALRVQATGGTFTLSFDPDGPGGSPPQTTDPIDFDASDNQGDNPQNEVLEALESLSAVDDVVVDGGPGDELGTSPYEITFLGPLAGADVAELTVDDSNLTGGAATATITTTAPGGSPAISVTGAPGDYEIAFDGPPLADANVPQVIPLTSGLTGSADVTTVDEGAAYEVCEAPLADCKLGYPLDFGGAFSIGTNLSPAALAVDQSDGSLYVTDVGNDRIQKFAADGTFIWAAGKGVNADGAPDPDLCLAGDACQAGEDDGTEASFADVGGIAVDQADGRLYVLDSDNDRAQVFEPGGSFAFMWGIDVAGGGVPETCASGCQPGDSQSGVLGGFGNPIDITVGDGGDVYVTQGSGSSQVLQVFDDPESDPTDAFFFATDHFIPPHTDPDTGQSIRGDSPQLLAIDTGATAGTGDDTLYVVNIPSGVAGGGTLGVPRQVLEFDVASEAHLDTHGAGEDFLDDGFDIAHDPDHGLAGDRLLWAGSFDSNGDLFEPPNRDNVAVLEDAAPPDPPEPLIDPVTVFDDTTATLEGTVDPNNNPTSYRFQYIDDASYQANGATFEGALTAPPVTDAAAGSGDAEVPALEEITDLNPGTLYHARLIARVTGGPNNGTEVASAEVEFTTDAAPPDAATSPVSAKTSSALLSGIVDPHGAETTYAFEYGTQGPCSNPANACDSTPLTSAGAAGGGQVVSANVTGLAPNATYHYRLIAESVLGEASTPDRTVVTIPQSTLPEDRVYEKATPDDKGDAELGTNYRQASASGDGLAHNPPLGNAFPGGESSQGLTNPYLSTRGPDGGWSTEALAPAFTPHGLDFKYQLRGYSDDLSRQLVWLSNATGVAGDGEGGYLRDNTAGAFTDLPGMSSGLASAGGPTVAWLWDPQMEHVAFVSEDDPVTPETPLDGSNYLHLWSEANGAELISRLPGGEIVPVSITGYRDHRVSAGGERVFWESNTPLDEGRPLYAYDAGATVEVSASERTPADPAGAGSAAFAEASLDGEVVLFTSAEKLTDDATATSGGEGGELYRYDFSRPAGERLTDLTPAPAAPGGAEVLSVVDTSEDGDRVYFVAFARLAPGGVAGKPNLYLSDSGGGAPVTTHVATLRPDYGALSSVSDFPAEADAETILARGNRFDFRAPLASADGRRLLFRSAAKPTGSPVGAQPQVYLYDASDDRLECVSCPPSGESAEREAWLASDTDPPVAGQGLRRHQLRNLSADGSRAFFQTAAALLPRDSNGKVDVYEWREGQLHLISSGRHPGDSTFVDASEDGDSVFFATRERLAPTDTDSFMDAYVARVDGVFPAAPPAPPLCEGDSCFPLPEEPEDPTPSTSNRLPSGNVAEGGANLRRCLRPARTAKRHSARAKRARRGLRRAARASNGRRVVRLRRVARRHARAAKQNANRAKRCRRAVRARANADRRADR